MTFFEKFGRSAYELKSIRCITVTGILIALDLVLKLFSIKITADLKITFAYLALAAIGMLYGPTVSFIAGVITDLIGFMISPEGGFSPLFTLVEAVGAMIYGLFLYEMKPPLGIKPITDGDKPARSLLKCIGISVGVGAAAAVVFGLIAFAVSTAVSGIFTEDKNIGKIIAALSAAENVYVAVIIGFLYGMMFTMIICAGKGSSGELGKSLRVVLSKVTVVIVCNLVMTPAAMVISGYMTWDSMIAAYPLRVIKNAIQCPVDCLILLIVMFPILAAYKKIFPDNGKVRKTNGVPDLKKR